MSIRPEPPACGAGQPAARRHRGETPHATAPAGAADCAANAAPPGAPQRAAESVPTGVNADARATGTTATAAQTPQGRLAGAAASAGETPGQNAVGEPAVEEAPRTATHPVTVFPAEWRFDASADEPVLRAAARAGVRLPSSCRNGTCRACMCQLTQGQVHYAGVRPGLSADEMAEGWILPCIARPLAALHLHVPAAEALDITPRGPIMVGPR